MTYTQLPGSYKYRHIAGAIYEREVEYFHYDFDRINFEHILSRTPDAPFASEIATRLESVRAQMGMVRAVIDALWSQIDDMAAYNLAAEELRRERAEKERGR